MVQVLNLPEPELNAKASYLLQQCERMLVNWKIIKFGLILGLLRLDEVHFRRFQTQKPKNRHITEGILLWAHGDQDTIQRRHCFRTTGSDVG